jgi:hypothetical protein
MSGGVKHVDKNKKNIKFFFLIISILQAFFFLLLCIKTSTKKVEKLFVTKKK